MKLWQIVVAGMVLGAGLSLVWLIGARERAHAQPMRASVPYRYEEERISANVWRVWDHEMGVMCYVQTSVGAISCIKLKEMRNGKRH